MPTQPLTAATSSGRKFSMPVYGIAQHLTDGEVLHAMLDGAMFVFGVDRDAVQQAGEQFAATVGRDRVILVDVTPELLRKAVTDTRARTRHDAPMRSLDGDPAGKIWLHGAVAVGLGKHEPGTPMVLSRTVRVADLTAGNRFSDGTLVDDEYRVLTATTDTAAQYLSGRLVHLILDPVPAPRTA